MKQLFKKIKTLFNTKQNKPYRGISECQMCGSNNLDKLGNDKYCKDCGTVL